MDTAKLLERIRKHPDSHRIGMIASHLGIVRGSSRDGRKVKEIEVAYDIDVLNDIVQHTKALPGIVEVSVDIREGLLKVGDELLFVAVGGDIRENVFPALIETVDRIKQKASRKKEIYEKEDKKWE